MIVLSPDYWYIRGTNRLVITFMRPVSILPLLTMLLLLSCQRSQPDAEPKQYSVPAEVEPYVQRFRDEMQKRGQTPATDNLIITFGKTQGDDICGQCSLQSGKTPRITLSTDSFCWQGANQNERECLVFHELGHCLLARQHRSDRFPTGPYVSLMNPNDVGVYAPCRYPIGNDDCDKRPRREYYLNELINPAAPTPIWGR